MKSIFVTEKRRRFAMFSIAVALLGGLVFLLAFSVSRPHTAENTSDHTGLQLHDAVWVMAINEKLQQRLATLQQLRKDFAAAAADTALAKRSDSISVVLLMEENKFSNDLQAAEAGMNSITSDTIMAGYKKMLTVYRSMFKNMQPSVVPALPAKSANDGVTENIHQQYRDAISEKENRIALLQAALTQVQKSRESLAQHTDAGAGLLETVTALENKLVNLNVLNNTLKQDKDRLQKALAEAAAAVAAETGNLKQKNIVLQQKVDEMQAEIRLAKVDCTLSRVDANQIISTARQRKALLTEASAILADLATTENSVVIKKVNEKIKHLNQVAANYRE